MAYIYIKNRKDPVQITNDRAGVLKMFFEDENTPRSKVISIGLWSGQLSEIKSIEFERPERKETKPMDDELTPEEKVRADQARERINEMIRESRLSKSKRTN